MSPKSGHYWIEKVSIFCLLAYMFVLILFSFRKVFFLTRHLLCKEAHYLSSKLAIHKVSPSGWKMILIS